jgi:ferredoxin
METRILRQDRLLGLVDALIEDHEVIAPRDERAYANIDAANEMDLRDEKPAMSLKEIFFPGREVLLAYQEGTSGITVAEPTDVDTTRVIFAARPCDAQALPILDQVFNWDYVDSSYTQRRENTTIVSVACEHPCDTCFCVSLGGSPAGTEGSDLLLTPLEGAYHVQVITEKGKKLVEQHAELFEASDPERDRRSVEAEREWRERIVRQVDIEGLDKALDFDSPVWDMLTQQCIDCGICTFLCPTCHCFDIQDEGNAEKGERVRLWDACAFYNYTKAHAGQPRPTHFQRYRQRIMHKFRYYPENFGRTLCVGCGRCIKHCPVRIDLRDVLEAVKE